MFTFQTFEPGTLIGTREYVFDSDALADWLKLFPEDANGDVMPPGMMAAITMRAYSDALKPRPPGNVHGSQRFEIRRLPRIGATLVTDLVCEAKELKKERRWVHLKTFTRWAGEPAFEGRMSILWAA